MADEINSTEIIEREYSDEELAIIQREDLLPEDMNKEVPSTIFKAFVPTSSEEIIKRIGAKDAEDALIKLLQGKKMEMFKTLYSKCDKSNLNFPSFLAKLLTHSCMNEFYELVGNMPKEKYTELFGNVLEAEYLRERELNFIIRQGADVMASIGKNKKSSLQLIIGSFNFDLITKFIEMGIPINHEDSNGRTALDDALRTLPRCSGDYANVSKLCFLIKMLLDSGATCNKSKKILEVYHKGFKKTPFHANFLDTTYDEEIKTLLKSRTSQWADN